MRKSDNRGFTLIELLIAIAILSIIVVPLMHSFVTAATTNAKAKRVLNATTAAENVLETIKSEDVETFMGANAAAGDADTGVLTKEMDSTVDGLDYHLIVKLDPTKYETAENEAASGTDYNSMTYAQLESLSPSDNALLLMYPSEMESAVSELMLLEPSGDIDEIRANLKRNITIAVQNNPSHTVVTATVTYTDGSYTYQSMEDYEIYNNSLQTDNTLSNVFVCFYPMYNNSGNVPTETITIDNSGNYKPDAGEPLKVYLVKQTGNDSAASAYTKSTYAVDVRVKEGSGSSPCIELATNLVYGQAAGNEMLLSYTGSTIPQGSTVAQALGVTAGEQGLWHAASDDRIYEVTIEVYRQKKDGEAYGTNDLLTTITGTKIE